MNEMQPLSDRKCLRCATPIQGRAGKRFCSSACKASFNRTTTINTQSTTATITPKVPVASQPVFPLASKETSSNDWQVRCVRAEEALNYQQEELSFHHAYTRLVGWFLRYTGGSTTLEGLDDMIQQVEEVAQAYQQHPSLRIKGHLAHRRLSDLYLVRDYMKLLRERRLAGEAHLIGPPWQPLDTVQLAWGLQEKHRSMMWDNLLAEV
jgi:hypothetical protein